MSFTNVPEFAEHRRQHVLDHALRDRRGGRGDWDDDEGGWWGRDDDRGRDSDGRFTISYGDLSATDGLAGYSCGGRITSGFEQETDLSEASRRTIDGEGKTAIFEIFSAVPATTISTTARLSSRARRLPRRLRAERFSRWRRRTARPQVVRTR